MGEMGEGRALLIGSLGLDPYERIEELRQAGERRAEASARLLQMEKLREVVLSRLRGAYESASASMGDKITEAKLDRLAHADKRYREHVLGMAAALEEKEKAEVAYWAIRAELEWDRAAVAHMNAMSRLEDPA
jgi:hypothetical protein